MRERDRDRERDKDRERETDREREGERERERHNGVREKHLCERNIDWLPSPMWGLNLQPAYVP